MIKLNQAYDIIYFYVQLGCVSSNFHTFSSIYTIICQKYDQYTYILNSKTPRL